MNLQTRLQECLSIPQQKEKIDAFSSVLNDILISSSNTQDLECYIDAVLNDQVGLVASRQLLSDFIALFDQKITNHSTQKQLLLYAIARTQPRSVSFEESASICICTYFNVDTFFFLCSSCHN